jgi:hypothetical protein
MAQNYSYPSQYDMGFKKKTIIREWIVLAICLGLGAHVALGVLLHGSLDWPTESYGLYGIFFGIFIYVVVQVSRSVWWVWKGQSKY